MKKNLIAIGVMCVLVAALGLGFYLMLEEDAPPPEIDGPAPVTYLFEYTRPPLSVRLEVPGWEYTLLRQEYDPGRNIVTDSTIPELEGLPIDTARVNAVIGAARSLTYLELVADNIADLSPFGLELWRARVRLDFEEYGQRGILIGDVAPGNIGVYIRLEGDTAVYLSPIHGLDNFLLSALDYLDMNVTPLISWPLEFDSMALAGQVREGAGEILLVAGDDGQHRLAQPFEHELCPLSSPVVLHSPFGIMAMGVALTHPTTEDLETLGLYPAWSTLTVEGGGHGGFTLHASAPDEGGMVFLYREGVPVVYTAHGHEMLWLEVQFHQLMDPFAVSPLLEELSRVEINWHSAYGPTFFDIEREDNELAVYYGGRLVDMQRFENFFINLISAQLEYLESQPEELGEPSISYSFIHRDGGESVVSFYPSEVPLRHYIRVDGGMVFLTPSAYIQGSEHFGLAQDVMGLISW